jgi:hypothetical protein
MTIEHALREAYLAADYHVAAPGGDIVLHIGEASAALGRLMARHGATGAVFITAWNPMGRMLDAPDNEARNRRLAEHLERIATRVLPGHGASPDGRWSEASFLALPVSRPRALALGRRYRQNAVVFAGADAVPELLLDPDPAGRR